MKCRNQSGKNNPAWRGGRHQTKKGYVRVRAPLDHPKALSGNYVAEHVLVMEKHLGRYLLPGENVHHKNGQKDDNRLKNLELWSTTQPGGQRVIDKLHWAREIVALYGEAEQLRLI